jgi:long-chain acyl-CoA synthetase
VCLLIPNLANLEALAQSRGWTSTRPADLLGRDEVRAVYQAEIDRVNADLAPFERIKYFALLDRELSQDGGELTPTLKVRRRIVSEKFSRVIERLYSDGAATREGHPPASQEEASA